MDSSVPNDSGTRQYRQTRGPRSAVLRENDGVGRRLNITSKAYTEWANERMGPAGIGLIPWVLLRHIDAAPEPGLSQKDLAGHLGVGGPTMVGHIDKLAADGLVTRTRDQADRRITRLAITDEGRRRLALGGERAHGLEQEVRAALGERRFGAFMAALELVHTYVSTDEGGTDDHR